MYTDVKQGDESQGIPFIFICNYFHCILYEMGSAYLSGF